jgi:hypothetical protein
MVPMCATARLFEPCPQMSLLLPGVNHLLLRQSLIYCTHQTGAFDSSSSGFQYSCQHCWRACTLHKTLIAHGESELVIFHTQSWWSLLLPHQSSHRSLSRPHFQQLLMLSSFHPDISGSTPCPYPATPCSPTSFLCHNQQLPASLPLSFYHYNFRRRQKKPAPLQLAGKISGSSGPSCVTAA